MTPNDPEAVVVDTMVISWMIEGDDLGLRATYERLIGRASIVLSFQTVAELRFGAARDDWGQLRRRRLERSISRFAVVQSDDTMASTWAKLRDECRRLGHPLWEKIHDGDRWIAASAMRLKVPVVI